jgi:hypothetical protein
MTHQTAVLSPSSYGPDKVLVGFWTLLCSPPALIWGYLFFNSPTAATGHPFLLMLAFALLPMLFASRFRATFTPTEFVYRRWGPTIRVAYKDIDCIEVTNVTPVSKQAVGAFIVTKGGSRLPFWPKLFPREAVKQFFGLAG